MPDSHRGWNMSIKLALGLPTTFADAERGAVGLIQVGTPKSFTTMNH